MIVFWRLVLAFLLADFTLQPFKFYKWKFSHPFAGKFIHALVFFILALLLCRNYLNLRWLNLYGLSVPGVAAIALISVFHLLIDELFKETRYKAVIKYSSTAAFLMQNLLQLLLLFIFTPAATLYASGSIFAEPWVAVVTGALLLLNFTDALIFCLEKDICQYTKNGLCSISTADMAVMSGMQRAVFYLIMLIPGYFFILFLVLWAWASRYAARQRILDISKTSLYFGSAFALLLGFLVRILING